MPTPGYNTSTGKAQYNADDNKQCEGCCGCDFCPQGTTPDEIEIVLSGFTNDCSVCEFLLGNWSSLFVDDMASVINGTHVLAKHSSNKCFFFDNNVGSATNERYTFSTEAECNTDNCTGTPAFSQGSTISISLRKTSSTTMQLRFASTSSNAQFSSVWNASTTGTSKCFEITGSWSEDVNSNEILNLGTITITET